MRKNINLIFVAIAFLTRLPLPGNINFDGANQRHAQRFYPLVGFILALLSLAVYFVAAAFLPVESAVVIMLLTTMLATGGLHEDGFADCCDGFGGGYGEKEKILTIMKDSRLGTFGVAGLVFIILLKWQLLVVLAAASPLLFLLAVVFCYSTSRWQPLLIMSSMNYVQHRDSKVENLENKFSTKELMKASVISVVTMVLIIINSSAGSMLAIFTIVVTTVFVLFFSRFFSAYLQRRLAGYTGDCLGAGQQITEVIIYLCFAAAVTQHWL